MSTQLKIGIDAQIMPGTSGGVSQFIASLVRALGQLPDGSETYTVIVGSQQQMDWIKTYSGPNHRFVLKSLFSNHGGSGSKNGHLNIPALCKRALRSLLPTARYYAQKLVNSPMQWPEVPLSDGFYESLGCDVVHIPTQNFVLCALPTIYNPHDLQHLHYPQFFTPSTIAWRETVYPAGCRLAHTVIANTQWIKNDIIRHYGIDADKIQVIPEGPPAPAGRKPPAEFIAAVKRKYQLEQPFGLYPAVTWPHKNHLRLLEALAQLRDTRNLMIQLVCTGSRYDTFWPQIQSRVDELKLSSQVKFLGFVSDDELSAIYRLSQFLVMPTLFEASSLPIYEAWLEGVPVICSNASALPEQVKDSALLFDPHSVEAIANAVAKVATNNTLRRELEIKGTRRIKDFDWERTARAYRAVYRRAAGFPLTEEDQWLLKWDWMRTPEVKMEASL